MSIGGITLIDASQSLSDDEYFAALQYQSPRWFNVLLHIGEVIAALAITAVML